MQNVHDWLAERRRIKLYRKTRLPVLLFVAVIALIAVLAHKAGAEEVYAAPIPPETFIIGVAYDAEVSAYTASADETDSRPWEMASGRTVYIGAIACPARIPFGAKVLIGDETYTCEDRMNGRYRDSNHFDILVETKAEAFKFGRQNLSVIVIQ